MASFDSLFSRKLASTKATRRTLEAAGVAIRIKHVGTTVTSTPTVVFSSTSSTLTLTDGAAAVTTIDLSAAAYDTMGELVDYINGLASWKCRILDALRTDASNNTMTDGAVTSAVKNGEVVFDCTSLIASGQLAAVVSVDTAIDNLRAKLGHRVTLDAIDLYATCTGGANCLQVYERDLLTKTETQIWGATTANNTPYSYAASSSTYPFNGITAAEGKELVVVAVGTVTTAPTTNVLQVGMTRE